MRNRTALLAALGADNFGSGLFLPLAARLPADAVHPAPARPLPSEAA
jgi:hypothetical protein